MSPPASPTGSTQPSTTSSTSVGSSSLRSLIAPSACVARLSAGHLVQRAVGLALAARRAHGVVDECVGHCLPPWVRREPAHQRESGAISSFHDLVGAGVDALHARVAIHARDRVFVHIAIAAEQLQAAVDDFVLQVGQPVLGHRGRDGIELAARCAARRSGRGRRGRSSPRSCTRPARTGCSGSR